MRCGDGHEAERGIGVERYNADDDDTVMKWEPSYMVVGRQVGDTSYIGENQPHTQRVRSPMRGGAGGTPYESVE